MRCRAAILAGALSLFVGVESAEAKLEILVEKASQRMVVIQDGYMRYIWPVSTGRDQLETPVGTYTPQRMERSWFSSEYYNSPMPYAIFFHNGYAIHGSNAIDRLGGPASHGCVRLHPHHAALLFDLVQQEGPQNTTIEVTDEPRIDGPPPRESEQAREIPPAMSRSEAIPRPPEALARPERPVDFRDMTELTATQRPIRPMMARPSPPPLMTRAPAPPLLTRAPAPPRSPPTERRQLSSLIDSAAPPRPPRLKPAEGALRARAESPPPPQPAPPATRPVQAAQSGQVAGMKVLPASCWSGGASRWRWWQSGQDTPCK